MTRPVACIVPVRNGATHVGEAIDSILRQTHAPLEVVVVDDGSTDDTADVVGGFGTAVRLLQQPWSGPAAARNLGVEASGADMLAFLDADDLWRPPKIARQLERMDADGADLCLAQVRCFWDASCAGREADARARKLVPVVTACLLSATLVRRRLFDRIGGFDTSFLVGDDTDWFLRVRASGARVTVLPDVLVDRRLHAASLTHGTNLFTRTTLLERAQRLIHARRAAAAASGVAP